MSAIWGVINLNKNITVDLSEYASIFKEAYGIFKIDRSEFISQNDCIIGCELQYLTNESISERLPSSSDNKIYTADCVLDNRAMLVEEFSVENNTPDGELLKMAYDRWGKEFGDHVLGAFSFAVYDTFANELTMVSDHLGNRSLFYAINNGLIFFSTAIVPLVKAAKAVPSEKWLAGCLCNTSADMMIFPELTPFDGILQLQNASILTITEKSAENFAKSYNSNSFSSHIYWNPYKIKPRKMSQSQAEKYFVLTLQKAVNDMLRSPAETGCTLSSGLDSSSIACLAAPILDKSGKKLFSFTSLPLSGFTCKEDFAIADETPGVKAVCEKYNNIVPAFLPCEGMDAFSALAEMVPIIGYPMKSGHNLTWLTEIYKSASKQDCKLMLKGQYGNSTISYGNALGTFYQLLSAGKLTTARHVAGSFCQKYRVPKKQFAKQFIYEWFHKNDSEKLDDEGILTSPSMLSTHHIEAAIKMTQKTCGGGVMDSRKKRIAFIQDPTALQQLGMFDTIMGLYNGILIRDPSKDKRVIEMVLSLPQESMMAGGVERGAVRTYMKGIVPDYILDDIWHRGMQSADYVYRTKLLWNRNQDNILNKCEISEANTYVDKEKCQSLVSAHKNLKSEDLNMSGLRALNVLYSECIFVNKFCEKD